MARVFTLLFLASALVLTSEPVPAQAVEVDAAPHTLRKEKYWRSGQQKNISKPASRKVVELERCLKQAGGSTKVDDLKEINDANKSKIASLCEKGKREIAQGYARDTATELMQDPRVVELQKCPEEVISTDPELSDLANPTGVQTNHHICD